MAKATTKTSSAQNPGTTGGVKPTKGAYDAVLVILDAALASGGQNLRDGDIRSMLEGLGFNVRAGSKAGHCTFSHSGLVGFPGGNYCGGHGKRPQVKICYIRNVRRVLREWATELKDLEK